jgi:protein-disulfide isomerase
MTTKTTTKTTSQAFANPWFAACLGLLGIIIGYIAGNNGGTPVQVAQVPTPAAIPSAPTPSSAPSYPSSAAAVAVTAPTSDDDYFKGDKDATISLIEYSDFDCPFCTRHHPTMAALVEANSDVNWVYRHLPLRSIHPGAQKAAEAAECAGKLGGDEAFWAVTDSMFEDGTTTDYTALATKVGLDATEFSDCVTNGDTAALVDADLASASKAGVRGTPGTIVYNNKTEESSVVSGARGQADIQAIIDSLLN